MIPPAESLPLKSYLLSRLQRVISLKLCVIPVLYANVTQMSGLAALLFAPGASRIYVGREP